MAIKCEICGASNLMKQGDSFVCQNCGITYSKESILAMMNSDANTSKSGSLASEVPGTAQNNDNNNSDNTSKSADELETAKVPDQIITPTVSQPDTHFQSNQQAAVISPDIQQQNTAAGITKEENNSSWFNYLPSKMSYALKRSLIGVGVSLTACIIFFNIGGSKNKVSASEKENNSSSKKITTVEAGDDENEAFVFQTETTAATTTAVFPETKATTTTTAATTKETTTTTVKEKPADAIKNDYEVFETDLFVHVDEADTLPLRDKPDRDTSTVITRIPDKTKVYVLGYKDTGSEIWFRLDYNGTKGWARGGMLQPKNIDDIWNDEYDLPGMDKWRSKFILDEEFQMFDSEEYADFKGTLYYQPDLSSGVQKRYKSTVFVEVYGVSYDSGEWFYVYTGDPTLENGGYGWVYTSQLSW